MSNEKKNHNFNNLKGAAQQNLYTVQVKASFKLSWFFDIPNNNKSV